MNNHFQYTDYKDFIISLVEKNNRRGEFSRIAEALGVSTVLVSQIFKSHKDLTFEQAIKLTEYFGFTELETKYFVNCLSFNKAGNQALKKFYKKEMDLIAKKSIEISSLVPNNKILSDLQKSIYYSDWSYAAVHLSSALPFIKNISDMAIYLGLDEDQVQKIITFLIECGLVQKISGELQIGTSHIHLDRSSSLLALHHRNWRMLSSVKAGNIEDDEVMYTAPMVISSKLADEIQANLLKFISDMVKSTDGCPDEETWNLNIDFVKMKDFRAKTSPPN
jgi:uncharacterized protein (TIGR02147 family)